MHLPAILAFALSFAVCAPAAAGAARTDTPSGFPVPRFASLKYDEVVCRSGPTTRHPVAATFKRRGVPVLIVAETVDHWRKIRDVDEAECWMHKTALRGLTHVLTARPVDLKLQPEDGSAIRARLAAGVLARLDGERRDWRKISASGISGWVRSSDLWGADPLHGATHN